MNNDIKLKPCPFCGNTNLYYTIGRVYAVECADCGGKIVGPFKTAEEANDAWNTRNEQFFTTEEIDLIRKIFQTQISTNEYDPNTKKKIITKCENFLKEI